MAAFAFEKGLHELGGGNYAYLQPDGSWGWNNAGLVVDGEESLLVDTLFDEVLTREMLAEMRAQVGRKGREMDYLVNTHANGDHTFGNRLVEGAQIIASKRAAEEMGEFPPEMLAELMRAAPQMGLLGEYLTACFGAFDFEGIPLTEPTRTFSDELTLEVGDKQVRLVEVGPAHTAGDILVHVPDDRVIYTGDILFIEGTPVIWAGPVGNWIRACNYIMSLEVEAIVPGHGPITDKQGVRRVRDYLTYLDTEARLRFDAGLSAGEAVAEIADAGLGEFASWSDAERLVVNVDTLYREYRGDTEAPPITELFTRMAEFWRRHRRD